MNLWVIVWRNLWRNRVRTLLTAVAIGVSVFVVCAVLALPAVRDQMIEQSVGGLRLVVQHDAGLTYWLPFAHVQRLRAISHVAAVNHWTYFGGSYREPREFFPSFAVDPETVAEVWPDYDWDPAVLDRFRRVRDGALVGGLTMDKYGWEIGDEVTLRNGILNLDLPFRIVGRIPQETLFSSTALWFSRHYLEEAARAVGGWNFVTLIWVRADEPLALPTTMLAIDELFRNSEAETATQAENAFIAGFLGSLSGLMWIVTLVGGVVVVVMILIAANTAAMSARGQVTEIAVLKALGFSSAKLFGVLVGEGLLIALGGGALGAGAAAMLSYAAGGSWSMYLGPLSLFSIPASVVAEGLLAALLVGGVASVLPAVGAVRMNVVSGLRR